MEIKTSLRFLRWLLITLSICLGGVLGFAQTKVEPSTKPTQPPAPMQVPRWHGSQKVITDAAGRTHVRNERITFVQRKAAARQRIQAMRQAAAKNKPAGVTK